MIVSALADPSPHVGLLAIDRLAACDASIASPALAAIVQRLDTDPAGAVSPWHLPARAIVTLARLSPEQARPHVTTFAGHAVWQVRAYAARAAAQLRDADTLERLAADVQANVREAAIRGLADVSGHGADALYRAALAADDYQLVRTAALVLDDTPDRREAVEALLAALDRLTAQQRDTSRDPRAAIVDRIAQIGSPEDLDRIRPYLADADPQIAGRAASLVTRWSGGEVQPSPSPRPVQAPPGRQERDDLAKATATVTMAGGRAFAIRLLPDEAPVTVARFARLARDGYYDGLTFHRVVPNFVIQGGSPGANEFMGDGPYLRDEVGLRPHVRGAVGISTRGRDTGDAQPFVDLIDNPRLDHNYTVFGQVIAGMDVVDDVLEGDVIERITIAP
jgi:cyclophilin family peptidyl-prolyl cis-trans isomerase